MGVIRPYYDHIVTMGDGLMNNSKVIRCINPGCIQNGGPWLFKGIHMHPQSNEQWIIFLCQECGTMWKVEVDKGGV
jgi:hypothetical protein